MKPLNLDINATMGVLPEVSKRLNSLHFLNPSAVHRGGQHARMVVETSREQVKDALKADRGDILFFTSGATESNNTALFMPFWDYLEFGGSLKDERFNIVISKVEHPSVFSCAERLKKMGVEVRLADPYEPKDFLSQCDQKTKLVSCMYVNNETGQIFPINNLVDTIKNSFPSLLIHSDGVQAFGKLKVHFSDLGVDLLSVSSHKIGGLGGCGALLCKAGTHIAPFIVGGPQETRRRAGTENVPGIAAFGIAAELATADFDMRHTTMVRFAETIREGVSRAVSDIRWNFSDVERIPNTLSLTIPGVMSADLVVALDLEGVYVSAGSACSSGKVDPSSALIASGVSFKEASETIRISVGFQGERTEYEHAASRIAQTILRMRQ